MARPPRLYVRYGTGAQHWLDQYIRTCVCERCKEAHPATLDFHYPDPETHALSVRTMVRRWSVERVKAEIPKYLVLCANCHRKQHWIDALVQRERTATTRSTGPWRSLSAIMKDKWAHDPEFRERHRQRIIAVNARRAAKKAAAAAEKAALNTAARKGPTQWLNR